MIASLHGTPHLLREKDLAELIRSVLDPFA